MLSSWLPACEGLSLGSSKPQLQEATADVSSIFRSWDVPMNEPVTWKSQFSLQSLFLTPSFPFIVLPEFPLSMGLG